MEGTILTEGIDVVLGDWGTGNALGAILKDRGRHVRAVSRRGDAIVPDGVERGGRRHEPR